LCFPH